MDSSGIAITGNLSVTGTMTNNGVNVGSTHVHGGVQSGGSPTGTPL
jgi:phage baseplate assembly protein gpV